jgi:hypothetical protein
VLKKMQRSKQEIEAQLASYLAFYLLLMLVCLASFGQARRGKRASKQEIEAQLSFYLCLLIRGKRASKEGEIEAKPNADLASCAQLQSKTFGVAKQEHPFYLTQGCLKHQRCLKEMLAYG